MKNTIRKNKGITLIALVITIIILLILAGVTIATLTGQNGILNRATETRGTNAYTQACEQARLAYMTVKTEIMTQMVSNSSYDARAVVAAKKIRNMVANELTGNGTWKVEPQESAITAPVTEITITYTNSSLRAGMVGGKPEHDGYIEFTIGLSQQDATLSIDGVGVSGESNGGENQDPAEPETPTAGFGDVNTAYIDRFGKKVTWDDETKTPSQGRNWRLFYADSNYAYLISDSIGSSSLDNTNIVKGWGTSTISTLARNLNSKYTANGDWSLKTNGELNNSIKAVAALLDTTKWTEYKSEDAEWAVGAPTLEMFVASYNATHSSTKASTLRVSSHEIACNVDEATPTWTGYKVSIDGGTPDTYITGLGNSSALDDAIYCPRSGFWWLASPSASDRDFMMIVYGEDGGYLYTDHYSLYEDEVRPLICVPISKIENGITITGNY